MLKWDPQTRTTDLELTRNFPDAYIIIRHIRSNFDLISLLSRIAHLDIISVFSMRRGFLNKPGSKKQSKRLNPDSEQKECGLGFMLILFDLN